MTIRISDVAKPREYIKFLPELQQIIPIPEKKNIAFNTLIDVVQKFGNSMISMWFILAKNCCDSLLNVMLPATLPLQ